MQRRLPIPDELLALIRDGLWPVGDDAFRSFPSVPIGIVRRLAPDQAEIYRYSPPFRTVQAEMLADARSFWSFDFAVVHELDPELAVVIGDFGLGSDAPLVLDYRRSLSSPSLLRLHWLPAGNHWVECAASFADFSRWLRAPS